MDLVWGIDWRILCLGVCKYTWDMAVPENLDGLIEAEVRTFFEGVGPTLQKIVQGPSRGRRLRAVAVGDRQRLAVSTVKPSPITDRS
jgi:hypothetical protein